MADVRYAPQVLFLVVLCCGTGLAAASVLHTAAAAAENPHIFAAGRVLFGDWLDSSGSKASSTSNTPAGTGSTSSEGSTPQDSGSEGSTVPINPAYIGCYKDDSNRDLGLRQDTTKGYTENSCAEFCREYIYFGLQNGGECFCGNSYGTPKETYPKLALDEGPLRINLQDKDERRMGCDFYGH